MLSVFETIKNIIFPRTCIGCEEKNEVLCDSCLSKCVFRDDIGCPLCGSPTLLSRLCDLCRDSSDLEVLLSLYDYEQPYINTLLHLAKYKGVLEAGERLGEIMAKRLKQNHYLELLQLSDALIIPVPLHSNRLVERGYNQSELIAESFAQAMGMTSKSVLTRTKDTVSQTTLTPLERLQNTKNAFSASLDARGRDCVLIDDVATTGQTLNACAQALKTAGAGRVIAITVARGA